VTGDASLVTVSESDAPYSSLRSSVRRRRPSPRTSIRRIYDGLEAWRFRLTDHFTRPSSFARNGSVPLEVVVDAAGMWGYGAEISIALGGVAVGVTSVYAGTAPVSGTCLAATFDSL
jgi:hypothetical protein